jgi:ferredoxin-NADP reductase
MMRHRRRAMPGRQIELIYSARTTEELIYADELDRDVTVALTREAPDGWPGHTGRGVRPAAEW